MLVVVVIVRGIASGRIVSLTMMMMMVVIVMVVLAAALLVLVELLVVHLGDAFDLFESDRALAEGTGGVQHQPLLDAGRVEVVTNVTGQGCHQRVLIEIHQADQAGFLRLEHICVVFGAEERAYEVFGGVEAIVLVLVILVEHVKDVRCTQQAQCQEKGRDQGRKDTKDNYDFVVELEHVRAIAFTTFVVRQLRDLNDVVDCPDAIRDIVVGVQEE